MTRLQLSSLIFSFQLDLLKHNYSKTKKTLLFRIAFFEFLVSINSLCDCFVPRNYNRLWNRMPSPDGNGILFLPPLSAEEKIQCTAGNSS